MASFCWFTNISALQKVFSIKQLAKADNSFFFNNQTSSQWRRSENKSLSAVSLITYVPYLFNPGNFRVLANDLILVIFTERIKILRVIWLLVFCLWYCKASRTMSFKAFWPHLALFRNCAPLVAGFHQKGIIPRMSKGSLKPMLNFLQKQDVFWISCNSVTVLAFSTLSFRPEHSPKSSLVSRHKENKGWVPSKKKRCHPHV